MMIPVVYLSGKESRSIRFSPNDNGVSWVQYHKVKCSYVVWYRIASAIRFFIGGVFY